MAKRCRSINFVALRVKTDIERTYTYIHSRCMHARERNRLRYIYTWQEISEINHGKI